MNDWRPFGCLAAVVCCLCAVLSAQRVKWELGPYDTAKFRRTTKSASKVVDPATPEGAASTPAKKKRPPAKNLVPNPSVEKLRRSVPVSWGKVVYHGSPKLVVARKLGHSGRNSVVIQAPKAVDAAWYCNVKVTPRTRYRLSGWIRTKDVGRGSGAQLSVYQLGSKVSTPTVGGTTEWKRVQVEFGSGGHAALRIHCSFGAHFDTKGTAWFDDVRLVQIPDPEPDNPIDAALFKRSRKRSWLRGTELDSKGVAVVKEPSDLRDVPAFLAFNMRTRAAKVKKQALTIPGFAPMWLEATFNAMTLEGTQRITARIRPARAKSRRSSRRPAKSKKGKNPTPLEMRAEGEVVVERRFKDKVLQGFTTELRLDVELPEGSKVLAGARRCAVDIRETWEYWRTELPEGGAFQARVNEAIRTGARYLRGHATARPGGGGRLGLLILTLLKAGEDPKDPLMQRLIGRLRKAVMKNTYDCSVGIMALEALYAPADERDLLIQGRIEAPIQRKLPPGDLAIMQEWTDQLRKNIDTRVDQGYTQRWNYNPGKRFDNSNTQYAMLGLYMASLCGVELPATVWFASANHWLESQCRPSGSAMHLDLESYQESIENEKKGGRRTVTRGPSVRPRGWSYTTKGGKATGSMTTAGITGLVICDSALHNAKKGTPALRNKIRKAVEGGFAWLSRNFSVSKNPGGNQRWHYYYLYGLERACELNGTKLMNGRRWYLEGAELLMNAQRPDGAWANVTDCCFAILFLKKAAPPVITGGR